MKTTRSTPARWTEARFFALIMATLHKIQQARAGQFAALRPTPDSIVFLGDSITEGGLWSEWFPDVVTLNRGISGETTTQIRERLATAIDTPRAVFLLAGTNDITAGRSPAFIAARLADIIDHIHRKAPTSPIYLQSVMPRKAKYAAEIRQINARLNRISEARAHVEYIDLWPVLADGDQLRSDYTYDGLHLTGPGYAAWTRAIQPVISAHTASKEMS